MRTPAGKAAPKNTDEYLAAVPEPARTTLNKIRATIRSVVPAETTEALGYGMPTFRYKGALVAFAAFSDHCSFFPMSAALVEQFKDGSRTSPRPKEPSASRWTNRFGNSREEVCEGAYRPERTEEKR